MKVAAYVRVSTAEQSTAMQREAIDAFCRQRGWEVVAVYGDVASGTQDARPELARLLRDAKEKNRPFAAIGVFRFDRAARSTLRMLEILKALQAAGVGFFSVTENISTDTPTGAVLLTLLAAFAQMEVEAIRERVREGLRHARTQGKRLGRPRVWVDVRRLEEMRAAGASIRQMALALGVSRGTVEAHLAQSA